MHDAPIPLLAAAVCVRLAVGLYSKQIQIVCGTAYLMFINPLIATLKPQSNGQSYSNTVIGTLVVDGWAVPNVTAHPSTASVPTSYYSM